MRALPDMHMGVSYVYTATLFLCRSVLSLRQMVHRSSSFSFAASSAHTHTQETQTRELMCHLAKPNGFFFVCFFHLYFETLMKK